MSEKNAQIKKLIEQMVQKEVRRLLPEAVKQVMAGMINEAVVNLPPTAGIDNSQKRRAIMEASGTGYEEYPTMGGRPFDRNRMSAAMGFEPLGMNVGGQFTGPAHQGMITAPAITEQGTAVNVELSDELLSAFNRDYSGLMKAMDKKKNG